MISIDRADLNASIEEYLQRRYDKLLNARFFRGVISSTTPGTPRTGKIILPNESASNGVDYACVTPWYIPFAGDEVECVWRDLKTAYILWPLDARLLAMNRIRAEATWPSGAQVDTAANWTKVPLSSAVTNPSSIFRSATSDFLIAIAGTYRFEGRASDNGVAAGVITALWKNGAEFKRGIDLQRNASGDTGGPVAYTGDFAVNDVLDLRIYNRDASNHNIVPSPSEAYATLQWMGGT
jgi:hypothetical protein